MHADLESMPIGVIGEPTEPVTFKPGAQVDSNSVGCSTHSEASGHADDPGLRGGVGEIVRQTENTD